MACVAEFGKGNFEAPLERFPGKKAFINDTIERLPDKSEGVHRRDEPHVRRTQPRAISTSSIPLDKFQGDYRVDGPGRQRDGGRSHCG